MSALPNIQNDTVQQNVSEPGETAPIDTLQESVDSVDMEED